MPPLIVLVRACQEKRTNFNVDKYAEILSQNGLESISLHPIQFEFYNDTTLKECLLNNHANYWSLALTSPRATTSVCNVFEKNKNPFITTLWTRKPIFAVGEATASGIYFSKNVIIPVMEQNSCGMVDECIVKCYQELGRPDLKVLFPCGTLSIDNLPTQLSRHNIPYEVCPVYRTVPNLYFEPALESCLSQLKNDECSLVFVFFSPSCVKNSQTTISRITTANRFHHISFVAIGQSTLAELHASNQNAIVCKRPTPTGVLDAILSIINPM